MQERLAARRRELNALLRRRDALARDDDRLPVAPTADWVAEKIRTLEDVLTGAGPAAALALRRMCGSVMVTEVTPTDRKRKYLRGTFTVRSTAALEAAGVAVDVSEAETVSELITIDFTDTLPWAAVADAVKALFDEGVSYADMATRLAVPRSWPAKALAWWHRERGSRSPDGRSVRDRLKLASESERLAERSKELWDEGLLVHQIAERLGCCRATVTAAVRHWFSSCGLANPDGRSRRKTLDRKSAPRGETAPRPAEQDGM